MSENVGLRFSTYTDLSEWVRHYEEDKCVQLWKSNSRTIDGARKKGLKRSVNPRLQYVEITYSCIHSGQYSSRSKGHRPNQGSYRQNCEAAIKVKATSDGEALEIIYCQDQHNHDMNRKREKRPLNSNVELQPGKAVPPICEITAKDLPPSHKRSDMKRMDSRRMCQKRRMLLLDAKEDKSCEASAKSLTENDLSIACRETDCPFASQNLNVLIRHLKEEHGMQFETGKVQFETEEEFHAWMKKLENETKSKFTRRSHRKTDHSEASYYRCNRSACFKPRIIQNRRRKRKLPSIKLDSYCTAHIDVKHTKQNILVTFCKTHYRHGPLETTSQPLEGSVHMKLAQKLSEGLSLEMACEDLAKTVPSTELEKVRKLVRKDISNMMLEFKLKKDDPDDGSALESWAVDMTELNTENPVRFFKPKGIDCSELHLFAEDFCLVVMTNLQCEFLALSGWKKIVCVDSTIGVCINHMEMTSLLVVDDYGESYPVAFMICNRNDVQSMKLFFQIIHDLVGPLTPQGFISPDNSIYYSAWVNVMGGVLKQYLSTWSVEVSMRRCLNMIENKNLRVEIWEKIRDYMYQPDGSEFLTDIVDVYSCNPGAKNYLEFFQENFCLRNEMWTLRFRNSFHPNTNSNLDDLHVALKILYLKGKKRKRLDKCLVDSVKLFRDKLSAHNITIARKKLISAVTLIQEMHKLSTSYPVKIVQVSEIRFIVIPDGSKDQFEIEKRKDTVCCEAMCEECQVCVHMFTCTCECSIMSSTICKHVHSLCKFLTCTPVVTTTTNTSPSMVTRLAGKRLNAEAPPSVEKLKSETVQKIRTDLEQCVNLIESVSDNTILSKVQDCVKSLLNVLKNTGQVDAPKVAECNSSRPVMTKNNVFSAQPNVQKAKECNSSTVEPSKCILLAVPGMPSKGNSSESSGVPTTNYILLSGQDVCNSSEVVSTKNTTFSGQAKTPKESGGERGGVLTTKYLLLPSQDNTSNLDAYNSSGLVIIENTALPGQKKLTEVELPKSSGVSILKNTALSDQAKVPRVEISSCSEVLTTKNTVSTGETKIQKVDISKSSGEPPTNYFLLPSQIQMPMLDAGNSSGFVILKNTALPGQAKLPEVDPSNSSKADTTNKKVSIVKRKSPQVDLSNSSEAVTTNKKVSVGKRKSPQVELSNSSEAITTNKKVSIGKRKSPQVSVPLSSGVVTTKNTALTSNVKPLSVDVSDSSKVVTAHKTPLKNQTRVQKVDVPNSTAEVTTKYIVVPGQAIMPGENVGNTSGLLVFHNTALPGQAIDSKENVPSNSGLLVLNNTDVPGQTKLSNVGQSNSFGLLKTKKTSTDKAKAPEDVPNSSAVLNTNYLLLSSQMNMPAIDAGIGSETVNAQNTDQLSQGKTLELASNSSTQPATNYVVVPGELKTPKVDVHNSSKEVTDYTVTPGILLIRPSLNSSAISPVVFTPPPNTFYTVPESSPIMYNAPTYVLNGSVVKDNIKKEVKS